MLMGLDSDQWTRVSPDGGYLATYTYTVSADARGVFVIEPGVDEYDASSVLIAPHNARIDIGRRLPILIHIEPGSPRRPQRP